MEAILVFLAIVGLGAFCALAIRAAHDPSARSHDPDVVPYGVTERAVVANVATRRQTAQAPARPAVCPVVRGQLPRQTAGGAARLDGLV